MRLRRYSLIAGSVVGAGLIGAVATAACSSQQSEPGLPIGSTTGGSNPGSSGGAPGTGTGGVGIVLGGAGGIIGGPGTPCVGLACQQTTCTAGNCTQKACSGATS